MNYLALFPGLPTIQLWLVVVYKNRGKGSTIFCVSDVNVYLGRQKKGGTLNHKSAFEAFLAVSMRVLKFQTFVKQKVITHCTERRTHAWNTHFHSRILPSPSSYLGRYWRHSHDKMGQAFPICFSILQAIKSGCWGRPGNKAVKDQLNTLPISLAPLVINLSQQQKHG